MARKIGVNRLFQGPLTKRKLYSPSFGKTKASAKAMRGKRPGMITYERRK
jgi:hypothetical protein